MAPDFHENNFLVDRVVLAQLKIIPPRRRVHAELTSQRRERLDKISSVVDRELGNCSVNTVEPFLLSDALQRLETNGFVALDAVVPEDEVDRLRRMLYHLYNNKIGYREGAQFDSVGDDSGGEVRLFPQIINPHLFAPRLLDGAYYSFAEDIAKRVLGKSARFKADVALLKPPKIGFCTPWHQDEAFLDPGYDYREVSIWLALTSAQIDNSCMSFIPRSHTWPVLEHRPLNGDTKNHVLECVGDFNPKEQVICPLDAGGCTIHVPRTLHYAGPNVSDQERLAYVLMFDALPVKRHDARKFPWLDDHVTARTRREQRWRKQGGLIIHAWRQRRRVRKDRLLSDLGRVVAAIRRL
jgi:ectoine hydroxylase-related dioxygenase (phytanoyl-CoA dioxygenase family)